ncbi:hypothetical protein P3L10_013840 [Capsicum annuum]
MDKSWMHEPKFTKIYIEGVESFMRLVRSHFERNTKIQCPCTDCLNVFFQTQEIVHDHLLLEEIMESYVHWRHHGEQSQIRDNNEVFYSEDENEAHDKDDGIRTMLEEVAEGSFANYSEETGNNVCSNLSEKEAITFDKLLKEAECELYRGCKKFLKLSFLVKLLHLKVYN